MKILQKELIMKNLKEKIINKIVIFFMVICLWSNTSQALQWSDSQVIKLDSSGNAVATWQSLDSTSGNFVIQAAFYDASTTTWSSPTDISSNTVNSFSPSLDTNSTGDAVVIWIQDDLMGNVSLIGSIRPSAGSFSTPAQISDANDLAILNEHFVHINDAGDILASWGSFIDNTYTAVVRVATADVTSGTWTTPVTISN